MVRVHFVGDGDQAAPTLAAVASQLGGQFDEPLAAKLLSSYSDALALAERDAATIARLKEETGELEPVIVPELAGDVHDVELFRERFHDAAKRVQTTRQDGLA